MNIDFIKVPFSNNPSMQKYDGPLFNSNPNKKYLFEKQLQIKKYGKDLFGQTEQYESSDLNKKVPSIRFSFSHFNKIEEIDYLVEVLKSFSKTPISL